MVLLPSAKSTLLIVIFFTYESVYGCFSISMVSLSHGRRTKIIVKEDWWCTSIEIGSDHGTNDSDAAQKRGLELK